MSIANGSHLRQTCDRDGIGGVIAKRSQNVASNRHSYSDSSKDLMLRLLIMSSSYVTRGRAAG